MGRRHKEQVMKKDEIQIGQSYKVKVSGNIAEVRITGENPYGGWDGVNVATNRAVRIKSAQRIRGLVNRPAKRAVAKTIEEAKAATDTQQAPKKVMTKAEYEAQAASEGGDVGPGAAIPVEAASKSKTRARHAKGEPSAKRPSGLDAAAAVLAEAGTAMNTKDMVERMLSTGMWKTGGKTPAATIYSAILREINTKGGESRFKKTDRGQFEFNAH
jgi:hypothetical protein